LRDRAVSAGDWAKAERGKVAVLGADRAIAEELLGPLVDQSGRMAEATVGGLRVYLTFDPRMVCKGAYIVGRDASVRELEPADDALRDVLSQAVGHSASVRVTTSASATTSSWNEGATKVIARWRRGALVELRVGEATP
jgi:hypothetical protein